MKASYLLSSLCLAPPALAAPLVHQTSVLVAGASTRTVVLRTGSQPSLLGGGGGPHALGNPRPETPAEDAPPSASLDSERPLTTAELMALSNPAVLSAPPGEEGAAEKPLAAAARGAVSVGALVAPGARPGNLARVLGVDSVKPYLVPGYYVSSQRADVLVVALILAFVLVVLAVETSGLVVGVVSRIFRCGKARRCAEDRGRGPVVGLVIMDYGLDSDDEDLAPFGGHRVRGEQRGLRLPEKLDEKAALI